MDGLKSFMLILLVTMVSLNSGATDRSSVLAASSSSSSCHRCNDKQTHPIESFQSIQSRSKRFANKPATSANSNRQDALGDSLGALNIREPIMDKAMTDNVTNSLNDMAQNLRRMFMENRKLQHQLQDVFGRIQNVTGVNVTTVAQNMPKNTNGMVNNIMNRLQQQQQ